MGPNKRISLCRQSAADDTDSEDERLGGKAADTSGFGSADGSEADSEEQPSPSCVSGAAAAAAGNSLPGSVHDGKSYGVHRKRTKGAISRLAVFLSARVRPSKTMWLL